MGFSSGSWKSSYFILSVGIKVEMKLSGMLQGCKNATNLCSSTPWVCPGLVTCLSSHAESSILPLSADVLWLGRDILACFSQCSFVYLRPWHPLTESFICIFPAILVLVAFHPPLFLIVMLYVIIVRACSHTHYTFNLYFVLVLQINISYCYH